MAYSSKRKVYWGIKPDERRVILFLGDILAAIIALLIALAIWSVEPDEWLRFSWQFILERPPEWFFFLPLVWILLMSGLYDHRRANRKKETVIGIGLNALLGAILYAMVFFISEPNTLPRLGVGVFLIGSTILTLLWRLIYIQIFTAPAFLRRVLIVGAGNSGSTLVNIAKKMRPKPFHIIGLIDDDETKKGTTIDEYPVLGGTDCLLDCIERHEISNVVFAISGDTNHDLLDSLLIAEENGIEVSTMPIVYEELLGRIPIYLLRHDWILRSFLDQAHINRFYEIGKRALDILGGIIGVVALILILPFVMLGILFDGGWPVFYQQVRLGKNGKEYKMIKFRSMTTDAEKDGVARPAEKNDTRITKIGKFLRKSHLDEIPQFINVLKGDMSLVGPRAERPEIIKEMQTYVPFYRARLLVKPGLTGWAQVNYGYTSTIEETAVKLEYDLYYIKHRNIVMDISIIIQTVAAVIGLRGR